METKALRLTREREARGFSRAELARRAKMSPSDISLIESHRFIPYTRQLRKIARALGWRIADAHRLLEPAVDDDDHEAVAVGRIGVQ
jgi:ribosome-binding protein aMBF1 (putative translation factor)